MSEVEEQSGEGRRARRSAGEGRSRTALIVLGMHRSGTSAVARMAGLLGADLPRHLVPGWEGNPKGHWEPEGVVALHDEILDEVSSSYDDVSRFPSGWFGSASERSRRDELVAILEEEYCGSGLFVIKDPRICRLVPFWLGALAELEAVPSFAIPIRNPIEVAASLKDRNGFSFPHGLLLWLRHVIDAERDTRGHPRAFVSYEKLLDDWEREARAIAQQLGFSWPRLGHAARAEIESFIDPRDRHHRATSSDLAAHTATVSWVVRAYDELLSACEEGASPSTEAMDEIAAVLDEADLAYGPLLAGARVNLREAQRQVRERDAQIEAAAGGEQAEEVAATARALAEAAEEAKRLDGERAALRAELAQREGDVERLSADRERVTEEVGGLTRQLQAAESERARLAADRAELAREFATATSALADQGERLEDALARLDRSEEEATRAAAALEERSVRHEALDSELTTTRSELVARTEELDRVAQDLSQAREREGRLHGHLASLDAQLEGLERALEGIRRETALAYFKAKPASKLSSLRQLLSWVFPLPRASGRRYVRTFFALRRRREFDYAYYLTTYPDVAIDGRQALMHYIEHGVREGRNPNPYFDTREYISRHPSLKTSGENPLLHHVRRRDESDPEGSPGA